jgi:hypothetical protein
MRTWPLAGILADEPYRLAWHRSQAITGPDDEVADELAASHLISLRRGSAAEAIWALERSAQLTTDSATRARRLLLAAEHAFGLGRADLVDELSAGRPEPGCPGWTWPGWNGCGRFSMTACPATRPGYSSSVRWPASGTGKVQSYKVSYPEYVAT